MTDDVNGLVAIGGFGEKESFSRPMMVRGFYSPNASESVVVRPSRNEVVSDVVRLPRPTLCTTRRFLPVVLVVPVVESLQSLERSTGIR
jgi:hypothetical protein